MARTLLLSLLTALLVLIAPATFAQSCDATRPVQVCALESPALRELQDPAQLLADIDLQVISQRTIGGNNKKPKAVDYTVSSPASAGGLFTLVAGGGQALTVSLTYNNFDGSSGLIKAPAAQGTPFTGTTAFRNASISIALADTTALPPPATYAGSFELELSQTTGCGNSCAATRVFLQLEITIPASIRISGLEDMAISYPALSATQQFCVFTTQGVAFGVRADSLHGSGSFVLAGSGGSGDTVVYQVSAGEVSGGLIALTEEVSSLDQGIAWPGSSSETCATGGENMQLRIDISPDEIDGALETTYTDTLTLVVETQ